MVDIEQRSEEGAAPGGGAPDELSDAVLEALARRESPALEAFFDAYFARIYGYVKRLVGEEHLAEDLTQDVFLQLYRNFGSYDPARELRPWVFAVATNKVRDFWRSRGHREGRRSESIDDDGSLFQLEGDGPGPADALEGSEQGRQLREAVEGLPEGLRMAVHLRVFEGLSFQAIGGILDCNEAAARKRYSRAVERLRTVFGAGRPGGEGAR
jgi:RNA polymerase sigma-70 factor (ECF subfamily)